MALLTATFKDRSDELSRFTVRVDDLAGTDVWTVVTGLANALEGLVEDLSLCTLVGINYAQQAIALDLERPTSEYAKRENGLRIFYRDATTQKKFNVTLPGPDATIIDNPGSDDVLLSVTEVAALVSWMESNVISDAGNAIVVDRAVQVGRNN